METPVFKFRSFQAGDINGAMALSTAEGWNQTESDWKLLTENPGNISLVAECDGKIVGTTTAIIYSHKVAWIGMILVDKKYRGYGISKSLLTTVLQELGNISSVKLDATPNGHMVYEKFDFKDEYLIERMVHRSPADIITGDIDATLEAAHVDHLAEIAALDESAFGANRKQLISHLLSENPHKAWVLKRDNNITGFVLGRNGNTHHHVGPLVATSTADAKSLIAKALHHLSNQSVLVDAPLENEELVSWLHAIGFSRQRHFTRMHKNENLFPGITRKQFLICGPEFG